MSRSIFLKLIIIVSLCAATILPTYIILILDPSFIEFITKNTENEAVKVGTHMSRMFFSDTETITKASLPPNFNSTLQELQQDFKIIKVKVFTATGEIIFSTSPEDVGKINNKEYFHNEVASGKSYTKIVQKDRQSLEGQIMTSDVVETYVPIMQNQQFSGAFEIYYDITNSKKALQHLLSQNTKTSISIAFCLLLAVLFTAVQAYRSLKMQKEAEKSLQVAHDELDMRVIQRTAELKEVNKTLQQEIMVRKEAEVEKEELISELQEAIEHIKGLRGLLPICASCKKIRDEDGKWTKVDEYIQENTEAELTHGICPECAHNLYPQIYGDAEEE